MIVRSRTGDRGPWPETVAVLAGGMTTVAPRRRGLVNGDRLSSAWVYDHDPRKRNAFVRPVVPASTPDRYVRRSLASWYGDAFDGKPTASGEPFDSNSGLTRLNRLIYQNL